MKKSTVLMIVFLLMAGISANAQLKFGLKTGVNLANVSIDGPLTDNLATSNLTGFMVGPMLEATVPVVGLGLDLAVLYSQQGFKFSDGGLEKTYKSNTLEVPVNLKWKLVFFKLIGVYGTAGPYVSFRLSDSLKDQFKSQSFGTGLNFGAGVEVLRHLQVGVNYQKGLTDDFSSLGTIQAWTDKKGKTSTWSVTAAYLF
jgi:hypothetical protein